MIKEKNIRDLFYYLIKWKKYLLIAITLFFFIGCALITNISVERAIKKNVKNLKWISTQYCVDTYKF
ncbi:MAG: hypothetical protein R6U84_04485, partial [Candidatus Cloacimonadales bacterium]